MMRDDVKARAVAAIRADKLVGRGSCSVIDECYDDAELAAMLEDRGVTTVRAAVAKARATHRVVHDVRIDCVAWGSLARVVMAMTLIPQFTAEFWGAVDEAATRLGVYAEDDDVAAAADRIAAAHNVDSTVAVTMIESQLSHDGRNDGRDGRLRRRSTS